MSNDRFVTAALRLYPNRIQGGKFYAPWSYQPIIYHLAPLYADLFVHNNHHIYIFASWGDHGLPAPYRYFVIPNALDKNGGPLSLCKSYEDIGRLLENVYSDIVRDDKETMLQNLATDERLDPTFRYIAEQIILKENNA